MEVESRGDRQRIGPDADFGRSLLPSRAEPRAVAQSAANRLNGNRWLLQYGCGRTSTHMAPSSQKETIGAILVAHCVS